VATISTTSRIVIPAVYIDGRSIPLTASGITLSYNTLRSEEVEIKFSSLTYFPIDSLNHVVELELPYSDIFEGGEIRIYNDCIFLSSEIQSFPHYMCKYEIYSKTPPTIKRLNSERNRFRRMIREAVE
jgi:hypothetical protein